MRDIITINMLFKNAPNWVLTECPVCMSMSPTSKLTGLCYCDCCGETSIAFNTKEGYLQLAEESFIVDMQNCIIYYDAKEKQRRRSS